ncbi:unnamed protein product [Mytilus coruscus]|uniref:Uncharacterized protein n=1 Tax=Mytilus coruscus TaxID=42192 RepID=A0A6J8CCZ9_MYTCO|nr:unnamed protein product [Mytilus coruscus]
MSQASFVSFCSSIPSEITDKQDKEFIEELHIVDELYFAQIESSQSENLSDDDGADSEYGDILIQIDPSDEDNREYISQARFRNESCGCKEFYGKPCSQVVSMDTVIDFREHCKELSRDELDLVIKSELFTHRRSGDLTAAKKHKQKDRERPFQEFYFAGHRVCRQTFCLHMELEKKKPLAIAKSLDNDGVAPRVHGVDNALPLPGRLPNFRNSQVLLLPSDKTAFDIHELYDKLAVEMKYRSVSVRTFQRLWSELSPNIVVSKPCTDLCCKCQDYAFKISNSGHLTEEEKSDLLDKYNEHVQLAKEQRDYYRRQCSMSK